MRVIATCIVALGLIASSAMADTSGPRDKETSPAASPNSAAVTTAQPASTAAPAANATSSTEPAASSMESELQQLRDLLEAQSKQLQEQQEKMQLLEEKLNDSNASKESLTASPASAETPSIGPTAGVVNAVPSQENTAPPTTINIKGISLTPGGFMAAETVWHQKAIGSDINTSFNANIFPGNNGAHISEFNASGRQSRISMLVEGKLDHVKIGGYYEMDFLSAGVTSNNNQSNSYTMRQRQFWGQAAFDSGWTITGGQQWSLLTETTSGLNNRSEALPQVIDAQYMVGFSWARQEGVRFTKNFNNKIFLGFSVEEPQATLTVHGNPTATSGGSVVCTSADCATTSTINPTTLNNFVLGSFGTSGGLYNPLGTYAFNPAPDLVFKAAFEPGFGHYEVFGVLSQFHDRVFPCVYTPSLSACGGVATSVADATNDSRTGGGFGANARWAILNKKVDVGIHFLGGDGIGRYGSAGLSDATVRPDGTLALIRNFQSLGTLQFHPTPKLDINLYVGGEYEARTAYLKSTGLASTSGNEGYGGLGLSNSGCWTETLPISAPSTSSNTGVPTGVGGSNGFIPDALANCTGDTRNIIEGAMQIWYRFYRGPKGTVQVGAQYANYIKNTWRGIGGAAGSISASGQPHSDQNMVFTSFRYVLP